MLSLLHIFENFCEYRKKETTYLSYEKGQNKPLLDITNALIVIIEDYLLPRKDLATSIC